MIFESDFERGKIIFVMLIIILKCVSNPLKSILFQLYDNNVKPFLTDLGLCLHLTILS